MAPLRAESWVDGEIEWDKKLVQIERDINSAFNKTTGKAPFEALYGFRPRFEEGVVRELTENCETYRDPAEVRTEIVDEIARSQAKYKALYDKHRRFIVEF